MTRQRKKNGNQTTNTGSPSLTKQRSDEKLEKTNCLWGPKNKGTKGTFCQQTIKMTAILIIFIILIFALKASIKDVFRIGIPLSFSDVVSGGWRQADAHVLSLYDTKLCNIDRKFADELSKEEFYSVYRFKKPVIVKFRNGAKDWTDVEKWTVNSLKKEYGMTSVLSGNSIGIVRNGGSGYVRSSFTEYIDRLMGSSDEIGDPL